MMTILNDGTRKGSAKTALALCADNDRNWISVRPSLLAVFDVTVALGLVGGDNDTAPMTLKCPNERPCCMFLIRCSHVVPNEEARAPPDLGAIRDSRARLSMPEDAAAPATSTAALHRILSHVSSSRPNAGPNSIVVVDPPSSASEGVTHSRRHAAIVRSSI